MKYKNTDLTDDGNTTVVIGYWKIVGKERAMKEPCDG